MREYKVNRSGEPKVPSKVTIGKYKNFTHLSHEYDRLTKRPKVPLYKDKKMFLVLLLIVLIAYILSQVVAEENELPETDNVETVDASNSQQGH